MRAAFLIGQANYEHSSGFDKLEHTHNDVAGVDEVLRTKCGFQVTRVMDASSVDFERLPRLFAQSLRGCSDGIFLFYYAGHGRCINGQHFLVPVDAANTDPSSLVNLYDLIQNVHDVSEGACAGTRRDAAAASSSQGAAGSSLLIVLDSCRERAEAQCKLASMTRARPPRPITTDVSILFACDEGKGAGENEELKQGLLTAAFIRALTCSGLTWHQVCEKARAECLKDSKNRQNPWLCHRSSRSSDLVLHNKEARSRQIDAVIHLAEESSCQTDVVIRSSEERSSQTDVVVSTVDEASSQTDVVVSIVEEASSQTDVVVSTVEASSQTDLQLWWAWRRHTRCWVEMTTSQFNGFALRNSGSCRSAVGIGFLRLLMICSMGYFLPRHEFIMDEYGFAIGFCFSVDLFFLFETPCVCIWRMARRLQRAGGDGHAEHWGSARWCCHFLLPCIYFAVCLVHGSFLQRTTPVAEVTGVDCAVTTLLLFSSFVVCWLDVPPSLPPPRDQTWTGVGTSFQHADTHRVAQDIWTQPCGGLEVCKICAKILALGLMSGVGTFVEIAFECWIKPWALPDWGLGLFVVVGVFFIPFLYVTDGIVARIIWASFPSFFESLSTCEIRRSRPRGSFLGDVLLFSVYGSHAIAKLLTFGSGFSGMWIHFSAIGHSCNINSHLVSWLARTCHRKCSLSLP